MKEDMYTIRPIGMRHDGVNTFSVRDPYIIVIYHYVQVIYTKIYSESRLPLHYDHFSIIDEI